MSKSLRKIIVDGREWKWKYENRAIHIFSDDKRKWRLSQSEFFLIMNAGETMTLEQYNEYRDKFSFGITPGAIAKFIKRVG